MPIVVKHAPSQQLLGRAGLLAGYGDFQFKALEAQQKQQQLDDANNRYYAGLAEQGYERGAQRKFTADREMYQALEQREMLNRRAQQTAWRDQWLGEQEARQDEERFGRQQQLQQERLQQQALSNAEIVRQRAFQGYQTKVAESLQEFNWTPTQERELAKLAQARISVDNNPRWDEDQKSSARAQLVDLEMRSIGLPTKRKEFPKIDGLFETGQAKWMTDPETGARVIASFDRNGAPRFTEIKPASSAETEHKKQLEELELQTKRVELLGKARKALEVVDTIKGITTQPTDEQVQAYIAKANQMAAGAGQAFGGAAQPAINAGPGRFGGIVNDMRRGAVPTGEPMQPAPMQSQPAPQGGPTLIDPRTGQRVATQPAPMQGPVAPPQPSPQQQIQARIAELQSQYPDPRKLPPAIRAELRQLVAQLQSAQ